VHDHTNHPNTIPQDGQMRGPETSPAHPARIQQIVYSTAQGHGRNGTTGSTA